MWVQVGLGSAVDVAVRRNTGTLGMGVGAEMPGV